MKWTVFIVFLLTLELASLRVHAQEGLEVVQLVPAIHTLAVPGGAISFTCLPLHVDYDVSDIDWMMNDTRLDTRNLPQGVEISFSRIGNGLGTLRIDEVNSTLNMSTVQCMATFTTGEEVMSNPASIVIRQDYLPPVGSLEVRDQGSDISLSWAAPYSLSPLSYCITVTNSSAQAVVHSECGITQRQFSYSMPPRTFCDVYFFTVTPVNEDGRGPETTTSYYGIQNRPVMSGMTRTSESSYSLANSAPVCRAELTFEDTDTGETITLGDTDVTIAGTDIIFTTQQLTQNRHYDATVTTSNIRGLTTTSFSISTHDVVNASIQTADDNQREISTTYSPHSVARGALYVLLPVKASEELQAIIVPVASTGSLTLPGGQYTIFVYDIEGDGLLEAGVGYPAVQTDSLLIPGQEPPPSVTPRHIEKCDSTSSQGLITVSCIYSVTPATGFQLVVSSSEDIMEGRLYTNSTENSDLTSIQVEENGTYWIAVLPTLNDGGIVGSNAEYTGTISVLISADGSTISETTTSASIFKTPSADGQATSQADSSVVGIISLSVLVSSIVIIIVIILSSVGAYKCHKRRKKREKYVVNLKKEAPSSSSMVQFSK